MKNLDPRLAKIIDDEIEQQYRITFFESFLENYIADFKPAFLSTISDSKYENYIRQKDNEAMQEFCRQIKSDKSIKEATASALYVLMSDFSE